MGKKAYINFPLIKFNLKITGTPHSRAIYSDHRGGLEEHEITKPARLFSAETGNSHSSWKCCLKPEHLSCSYMLPVVWKWHMGNIISLCPQAYKAMPGQTFGSRCRIRLSLPGSKVTPAARRDAHAQPGAGSCHADPKCHLVSCPLTEQPRGHSPASLRRLRPTQNHVPPPAEHSQPHPIQLWIISLVQSVWHHCPIQLTATTVASKQQEQRGPAVGPLLLTIPGRGRLGLRKSQQNFNLWLSGRAKAYALRFISYYTALC